MSSSKPPLTLPLAGAREAALLKWVKTFPLERSVGALDELCDGKVFCEILEDFDRGYAISEKEKTGGGSTAWLKKKACLEAVYKSLRRYIRDNITELNLDYLTVKDNVNVDAIAEHEDVEQTMKLLAIFLMAALLGPRQDTYIGNIQEKLDQGSQHEIMKLFAEMQELQKEHKGDSARSDMDFSPEVQRDFDLAFEEQHSKLKSDHATLKKKHADYITRIEELQVKNEELHERNDALAQKLSTLEKTNSNDQAEFIMKGQRKTIEELETLIETHENQIELNRVEKEKTFREVNSLRRSNDRLTELEDEVSVLRNENVSLVKKANMVDHFQRKLEMQSNLENVNAKLRDQIDVLENNQKDYDQVHADNEKYQKTLRENRQTLEHYEIQLVESQQQNKTLKDELRNCESKIVDLETKGLRDEDFIRDLQNQLLNNGGGIIPTPTTEHALLSLEQELEQSEDDSAHMLRLENSRLKAENQLLKSGNNGATSAEVQLQLEESERVRKRYEENLEELTVKHTIGQEQLNALISKSPDEKLVQNIDAVMRIGDIRLLTKGSNRDEAIHNTRKNYLETNQELSVTKKRLAELEIELSGRDRDLLTAKAQLETLTAEEIDALDILKRTNITVTSSLQHDLRLLQGKMKTLEIDLQQHQKHLIQAILAKDKLEKELATGETPNKSPIVSSTPIEEDSSKSALEALKEQTQKHDQIVQDLQKQLKLAGEGGLEAQKLGQQDLVRTLTRENSLMATAWYDLSSRLQSNHVVLQRRQDAPKSWLNKQRQMVNATPRR